MAGVRIVVSFCLMQLICGSCPPGQFGKSCLFLCHCGVYCDVTTGACGAKCDAGWVGGWGRNCQKQNVAYHRPASSPTGSQRPAWTPDKAVDGDRRQDVYTDTCFHPAVPPSPPSQWTVDLGRVYRLHDVRIYNRKEYVSRIRGATINLHNTSSGTGVTCYTFTYDTQEADGVYDVTCDGHGRYLTISHDNHTLNLCEVEVYVCSNGSYGTHCDEFCRGCLNDTCDPVSGICPGGCRRGRQGPTCAECLDGRYGIYCDQFCNSRNCITTSSSCDVNGACTDGCRDGWMNTDCRQPCPGSTYGPNCSKSCNSRHCQTPSSSCDHVTGACDGDVCEDGWLGNDCAEKCRDGRYGVHCDQLCNSRKCITTSSSCDVTGACTGGCRDGWKSQDCRQPCSGSTFGPNCSKSCNSRHCQTPSSSCNHVTGACDGGVCEDGWLGTDCAEKCRDGRYGVHCDQLCNSRNCITTSSSCDVTGACTDGCRDGWKSQDCRQPCPGSTFGPNCSKSCNSRHCQTPSSSCDHVTGACDGGVCEDGWLGTDCAETQTMSTVTVAAPVRISSQVMWNMIGGAVGIVVTLLLIGALMMCLLRTGRLSWKSADVNQAVKMNDVIVNDQSTEGSQQADSEAGVTNNVYSYLDDVTRADNGTYDTIMQQRH
ncbi:multiple epidermal growth factor-like domains protein 10 [Haliotis cracherodii]|uniref:multiple epidermal growth factor-like domains protein 10 n=1 Tax=Haliotis cracherodii TaxID=6455 RepID=UPI0039ECB877